MRGTAASTVAVLVLVLASLPQAQAPTATLTLISREGRRPIPTSVLNNQELVALDDLTSLFQISVKEDAAAGGVTVSSRGRTIVMLANQATASVNGRAVALPAPVIRSGRRWLVPIEFLQTALGPVYDQRIQVRRSARLVILGDIRVPRVSARIDTAGPPTRMVIEARPAAALTAIQEGARLSIRVDADALELALPPSGAGLVQQVRAGDQPNTLSVLLDASAGPIRAVPSTADNVTRLTIDVPAQQPQGTVPESTEPAAPPRPTAPPSPAVDPSVLLTPRAALQTVVIDPGHGGDDVGVRGAAGAQEKQLTLDIARRLRALLESRLGVRVILTREDDKTVGPDARAAIANNGNADLFVSLHANAAPTAVATGAEVYYLQLDREGEQVRQQAAKAAVSVPVAGGGTRTLDIIRWDLAQARHVNASAVFASMIAQDLGTRIPMAFSPIRQAPLRVLEGVDMPAALVEMAYLTNPTQEKLAASEDYRNAVALAIHDAVVRFRRYLEEARPR